MGDSHPEELREWFESAELRGSGGTVSLSAAIEWPSKLGHPLKTKKPLKLRSRSEQVRAVASRERKRTQANSEQASVRLASGWRAGVVRYDINV